MSAPTRKWVIEFEATSAGAAQAKQAVEQLPTTHPVRLLDVQNYLNEHRWVADVYQHPATPTTTTTP